MITSIYEIVGDLTPDEVRDLSSGYSTRVSLSAWKSP